MFIIKKIKKKTIILLGIIAVLSILLCLRFSACSIIPSTATSSIGTYSLLAETKNQRKSFLEQFGWQVEKEPTETVQIVVPEEFNNVYLKYNEIQQKQGLDLTPYKGRKCTRYTYKILNYENIKTVQGTLIVCENRVIGADISDVALGGFMTTLIKE